MFLSLTSGSDESCGSDEAEDGVEGRSLNVLPALDGISQEHERRDDREGHDHSGTQNLGIDLLRIDNVLGVELHVRSAEENLGPGNENKLKSKENSGEKLKRFQIHTF